MSYGEEKIKNRHFPRLGKCICCFCLKEDKSTITCTYLLMVFFVSSLSYSIHRAGFNIHTILGSIVSVILIISLILLLIGIIKVKINYLKQFKYIFFIFLLYTLFDLVSTFYRYIISDSFYDAMYKELKNGNNDMKESEIKAFIKLKSYSYLGISLVELIIYTYYYFVTCSYIEDVEVTVGYNLDNREYESGLINSNSNDEFWNINIYQKNKKQKTKNKKTTRVRTVSLI